MKGSVIRRGKKSWCLKFDLGRDPLIATANKTLRELYEQLGNLMAAKTLRDLEIKK